MTGFQSKRMAVEDRHAPQPRFDHLMLYKKLEAEEQVRRVDNIEAFCRNWWSAAVEQGLMTSLTRDQLIAEEKWKEFSGKTPITKPRLQVQREYVWQRRAVDHAPLSVIASELGCSRENVKGIWRRLKRDTTITIESVNPKNQPERTS
jgi:hypothetical protein